MSNTTQAVTIGLDQIKFGEAAPSGTMPVTMTKIGMVYKGTCSVQQDAADRTEHYEEGKAIPFVVKKTKKAPTMTFSLVVDDVNLLTSVLGGEVIDTTGWGMNGNELPANKAVKLISKQGFDIEIPNADIDANIDASYGDDGIFLVTVTVTPLSVTTGKGFRLVKHVDE